MKTLEAIGQYVVIKPTPKNKLGGEGNLAIIDKWDNENRYLIGEVISAGKDLPLKTGDKVYYDKANKSGVDFNGVLYQVLSIGNIVAVEREEG